jgi:hypothetical protein
VSKSRTRFPYDAAYPIAREVFRLLGMKYVEPKDREAPEYEAMVTGE